MNHVSTTKLDTLRAELAAAVAEFNASEATADPVARLELAARLKELRDRVKYHGRASVRGVVTGTTHASGIIKTRGISAL